MSWGVTGAAAARRRGPAVPELQGELGRRAGQVRSTWRRRGRRAHARAAVLVRAEGPRRARHCAQRMTQPGPSQRPASSLQEKKQNASPQTTRH